VTSRAFKGSLALLAGAAALAFWWRTFGGPRVLELVRGASGAFLAVALGLMVAAQAFRLLRWHLLLRHVGPVPLSRTFRLLYASELLNNLLPVKVGDLGRAVALASRSPEFTIGSATASMVVDRLYGILARILALALLPLVPSQLPGSLRLSIALFTLVLVGSGALLIAWSRHADHLSRLLTPLLRAVPLRAREPVGRTLRSFADATVSMGIRPPLAAALTGLSLGALVVQAAAIAALFRAVGEPLPPIVALVGSALMDLLAVVPAPPAGIGTAEWYGTLVFATALGQPTGPTAAAALMYHAAWLLIVFVAGGLSVGAVGEMLPRRAPEVAT
jgi:uncharacterized protein (TIRG00374 family)